MSLFDPLAALLREAAAGRTLVEAADRLTLNDADGGFVAMVEQRASGTAFHLMPLYCDPTLGEGMSAALSRRRSGKSCFKLKPGDEALLSELTALTRRALKG